MSDVPHCLPYAIYIREKPGSLPSRLPPLLWFCKQPQKLDTTNFLTLLQQDFLPLLSDQYISVKITNSKEEARMNKQLSFASFDENFAMLQKIQPQLLQLLEDFIDTRTNPFYLVA
jgi:hypothetical protein